MNDILQSYTKLVEFLGNVLGSEFEVVLHDLRGKEHRVSAIANAGTSGRTVNSPMTTLGLKFITDKVYEKTDYLKNYRGVSHDGQTFRSSTFFIKDEQENLIGMLCVNFNTSKYESTLQNLADLCNMLLPGEAESIGDIPADNTEDIERLSLSTTEVISSTISSILSGTGTSVDRLTLEDRIKIIDLLNKKEIFLLKGAVNEVAKQLMISSPTIYRYISRVTKNPE